MYCSWYPPLRGVSVERSSDDSHDKPAAATESSENAERGEELADERAEAEATEAGEEAHGEDAAG